MLRTLRTLRVYFWQGLLETVVGECHALHIDLPAGLCSSRGQISLAVDEQSSFLKVRFQEGKRVVCRFKYYRIETFPNLQCVFKRLKQSIHGWFWIWATHDYLTHHPSLSTVKNCEAD